MPMNKNSYWADRARKDKLKVIKTGEKGINNLKRLLLLNIKDVEKQIKDFYDTYGNNPAEEMSHKEWQQYKSRLKKLAKSNPQDATIQRLAKQNIPKYKIDRLRALELDLQMQLTEVTLGQEKGIYKTLDDVSKVSQATLATRMNKTLGLTFTAISANKMKQILMSDWSGANWSERLWKDRQKVGKKLSQVLQKGIPQGVSLQKMSRELRDLTGESFNDAFRLIRTETAFIDTQVTFEGFEQARKELGLEYYMYDAFLDSRTSAICREMDGKYFKITEREIGINAPPLHPSCRSHIQLILDDEDMKEPVKELTEFKDFGKFNRKAYGLADFAKKAKNPTQWARNNYDKNTLDSFYNLGKLTEEQKKLLGSKSDNIKFSLDSMIKNRLHHPDVNFYDYQKLSDIIANPDDIKLDKKRSNCILLLKKDGKMYQAVIKTTKDKSENFLTSFRYAEH